MKKNFDKESWCTVKAYLSTTLPESLDTPLHNISDPVQESTHENGDGTEVFNDQTDEDPEAGFDFNDLPSIMANPVSFMEKILADDDKDLSANFLSYLNQELEEFEHDIADSIELSIPDSIKLFVNLIPGAKAVLNHSTNLKKLKDWLELDAVSKKKII